MKKQKGFTLVEILIVIVVIALLAAAFIPKLLNAPSQARDKARIYTAQKIAGVILSEMTNTPLTHGGCITYNSSTGEPDVTYGYVGPEIKIEDFGGQWPTDPMASNDFKIIENCYGYAILLDEQVQQGNVFGGSDPLYPMFTFGVFVRVENQENSNMRCPDGNLANAWLTQAFNFPGAPCEETARGCCYGALISDL